MGLEIGMTDFINSFVILVLCYIYMYIILYYMFI